MWQVYVGAGVIIFILVDILLVIQFWQWKANRAASDGLAYCSICGDFAKVCCSDSTKDPDSKTMEFPRCFECCDHTHSPEERD